MQDAVFTRTFALDSGPRVRLRLARPNDLEAVEELLAARGVGASELDVRRLLAYQVTKRRVLAACALIDGVDRLVGVAGIDLSEDAEVDTLVVDRRLPEVGEILVSVLRGRARAHARRAAAA